ncbi:hypothetical protein [Stappia sp. ES.058]|uniref:hypothetical protein n=1 Tax=Stappia sp. ES.058 TaxID=1881061 RepID=UPI00087C75B1|nr:hypothetical protein [Stappia sp. ES.058]SDU03865.1 hypothetical protein SAMN05428979_1266 [Stappia sp. ES.058]
MLKLACRIPLVGLFVKSAVKGSYTERLAFAVNILVIFGICVAVFGYPVVIMAALVMTAIMFTIIVGVTSQALWSRSMD